MASYLPLPAYQVPRNALLDLSPINDAIDTGIKVKQQGVENQYRERDFGLRERQLSEAAAQRAADNSFRAQQFKFQQERAGAEDKFRQSQLGLQQSQFGLQQSKFNDERERNFVTAAAGVAQLVASEQDQNVAAAQWKRLVDSDPRFSQALKRYGVDPYDHVNGSKLIIADARGYQSPDQGYKLENIKDGETPVLFNNKTGRVSAVPGFENRAPKLSDSDKTRIVEQTQSAQSTASAIATLDEAARLNQTARSGALAKPIASVVSGVSPLPTPASDDTLKLDAQLKKVALDQLKSTFGGNPTEGEREILLQLTGSVNNNRAVRGSLIQAAREAAVNRQRIQAQIAEDIRTGKIYQPGYQPPVVQDAPLVREWLKSGGVTNPTIPRDRAQGAMPDKPGGGVPSGWKVEVE